MAAFERYMIAPYESGIDRSLRPWIIPDDAFEDLRNMYPYRGRIVKRFGSEFTGFGFPDQVLAPFYSKVAIPLDDGMGNPVITDGAGNASGTVPGSIFQVGQLFTIGNAIYTVYQTGAAQPMLATIATTTKTYDTTNGNYNFVGAPANEQVWFYPDQPIMGLPLYEVGQINDQPSYAFDTQFAYEFTGGRWIRSGFLTWHGTDTNFFFTCNWESQANNATALFTTNFFATNPNGLWTAQDDPIRFYNGTLWLNYANNSTLNTWNTVIITPFTVPNPPPTPATVFRPYLVNGLIILPFKNRLLILNTIENDGNIGTDPDMPDPSASLNRNYKNRCRYSALTSPFVGNAWLERNQTFNGLRFTGAGFIDAATEEAIVSAEFLKDRLIVYFEESTWEVIYTGSDIEPFRWQKINTELGSQSTFSSVPFDREVIAVGQTGIHACTGGNVLRIDNKIPNQVFEIADENNGVKRVYGVRDYFTELIYWTFTSDYENIFTRYPNKVLVFNYKNSTWGINDDCITAFGYFEQQLDATWASTDETWEEMDAVWGAGNLSGNFRQVIAGNQQGFIFIVNPELNRNASVMNITQMAYDAATLTLTLTVVNHTLVDQQYYDYVRIENAQGVTFDGDGIFKVTRVPTADENTIELYPVLQFAGTYTGGGTLSRVSNPQILTKQWNPYTNKGQNVFIGKIDFLVDKTSNGQIFVDYYTSSTQQSVPVEAALTTAAQGNSVLSTSPYDIYPLEKIQDRLWHALYFQTQGQCIQLFMYLKENQITNPEIAYSEIQLHAMILHTKPSSARLQ